MSLERARHLVGRFRDQVRAHHPRTPRPEWGLPPELGRDLLESMLLARELDTCAHELRSRGLGHYTICSTGHEANVVLGRLTGPHDPSIVHYRSAALQVERARQVGGVDPVRDIVLSYDRLERRADQRRPPQGVRQQAAGHHPQHQHHCFTAAACAGARLRPRARAPRRGGAARRAFGHRLGQLRRCQPESLDRPRRAQRDQLDAAPEPARALAVRLRGQRPGHLRPHPRGLGRDPPPCPAPRRILPRRRLGFLDQTFRTARAVVEHCRRTRRAAVLHLGTVRLLGHAGSDVDTTYRPQAEIDAAELRIRCCAQPWI